MFNLEQSITNWRQQMLAAGIKAPAPLEELEIHLREDVENQIQSGLSAQQAFETTVQQIGRAEVVKREFVKISGPIHERLKQIVFSLAGAPNYQPVNNMNTNTPNIEPCWATYAKAGTFLFPALIMWLLTVVFVLPKAAEICQAAGMTIFNFDPSAPATVRAWGVIGQIMILLTSHWFLISGAIILAVVLLERYFNEWPRYRRAAIGAGAFLLNAVVLLSLTIMIVSIIVAAPALAHHIK